MLGTWHPLGALEGGLKGDSPGDFWVLGSYTSKASSYHFVLILGVDRILDMCRGSLDRSLPFDILRRKSLINERARAADGFDDFSHRIRRGLPGIP